MITCSRLDDVIARRRAYLEQLIEERAGGPLRALETEGAALRWGRENERRARAAYAMRADVDVIVAPFQLCAEIPCFGGSADGLIGVDGIVEFKNPWAEEVHLANTVLPPDRRARYWSQVQGLLMVYRRGWCDWVSYDARLEPLP